MAGPRKSAAAASKAGRGGVSGQGGVPPRRRAAAKRAVAESNDPPKGRPNPNDVERRPRMGHDRKRVELVGKMALLANGALNPDTGRPWSVADMDDEELARMQFRDRNGTFTGRPPANLPRVLVDAMRRELMQRATEELQKGLLPSLEALHKIISSTDAKDSDKIKAIDIYLTRMLGKTPDRLEVSAEPTGFENVMATIMRKAQASEEEAAQ